MGITANPAIGSIALFAGNFAPRGWAFCSGQLLLISQNDALFSLIGAIYGGDARTTFALPDLRGRVPVGEGNGPGLPSVGLGERGGLEDVTLVANELGPHTHSGTGDFDVPLDATSANGNQAAPGPANVLAAGFAVGASSAVNVYHAAENPVPVSLAAGQLAVTAQSTGGGQSHENRQPYLGLNYVIALVGIYPSRN